MQLPAIDVPQPVRKAPVRKSWVIAPAIIAGFGWLAWRFAVPLLFSGTAGELPLTETARRNELVVTVGDRGELESLKAITVTCDLEGGAKLVSIVAEGKYVNEGDLVCEFDPDQYLKLFNEQRVKVEAAEGKVKACKSDVTQAESKAGTEKAKAKKTLDLAKIEYEAYVAKDGEFVKESEGLKGELELARKELVEAEEDLDFTKKQVRKGFGDQTAVKAKELNVQQRKFNVAKAQAALTLLENYTRRKKITELEFNAKDAERELTQTEAAQNSAIEKAKSELKAAEGTLAIEKETLTRIEKQLQLCKVKAPASGILVYANRRYWDESSRIRPGAQLHSQQEIFSLPDLTRMKVKMKVHEAAIKKVKPGMDATITLDALPNRVLHGKVVSIATIAQSDGWRGQGVKQYETEVSIDDLPTDAGLKPGMTADVKIYSNRIADALLVPISAVTDFDGESVVYRVRGREVERLKVTVGEKSDQHVQILDGLSEGDAVALDARVRAAADLKASKPDKGKPAAK